MAEIKKLGFGLMRLPKEKDNPKVMDMPQIMAMVDAFMKAGFTYFDTAFVYDGGRSEDAARKALVERYNREDFQLATKLCAWMGCTDEDSAKAQFYTSLKRTGAGYFDYYLLHALQRDNYKKYDEYHIWDFVKELKKEGKVRHYGFSFHADPALLEQLLIEHPDVDFVQLQINYADWENPTVSARKNYEIARKHNKPVIIMEPVKGGLLAEPPERVAEILKKADPKASCASWALQFAASLDGVLTVLSGMSDLEQMEDNLKSMNEKTWFSKEKQKVIEMAGAQLNEVDTIPCTACHYCTAGCPKEIRIPDIFGARNKLYLYGNQKIAQQEYNYNAKKGHKASDCIACGLCEKACPQQIAIRSRLKEAAEIFDRSGS